MKSQYAVGEICAVESKVWYRYLLDHMKQQKLWDIMVDFKESITDKMM